MSHERDAILNAMGGKRGLIDNGLPSILFLIVFNIQHDLRSAIYAAIALSGVLAVWRLIKRDTLQHAISGVIGVLICAWFAKQGGQAKDYYIPSFIKNSAYAAVYAFGNLIGWPILGLVIGPIIGENLEWRKVAARKRVYVMAGWLWVGMFFSRIAVQYPIYRSGNVNLLGTVNLAMGYPLFLATAYGSWMILRAVPTTKVES